MCHTANTRQLLVSKVEASQLEATMRCFEETRDVQLRRSVRVATAGPSRPSNSNIVHNDTIRFDGMKHTIGYSVQQFGQSTANPITRKEKYFHYTAINSMIDISMYSRPSFLKEISTDAIPSLSSISSIEFREYNMDTKRYFCRVSNTNSIAKLYDNLKDNYYEDIMPQNVQDIYMFITSIFHRKYFMFDAARINMYSEADFVVKFWAPVFESFFGTDHNIFLHWGETSPQNCFIMDSTNCEYAAKATCGKLFKDRLKMVLGGKAYINEIIKTCPYINETEITNIKVPLVQIMGFKAVLSMISLKDKSVYVVKYLMKFKFPTTARHIREGAIIDLIKAMSLIETMVKTLDVICEEGRYDHEQDHMGHIGSESSRGRRPSNNTWTSNTVSGDDLKDAHEEEEDDDDDEESAAQLFN